MRTPEYEAWRDARDAASDQNAWMAAPVLAVIPCGWGGRGAGLAVRFCRCFTAETLVDTPDGLRPIESIGVGDLVLSRDELTGETAYRPITALVRSEARPIWEVTLTVHYADGTSRTEILSITDDHPWRTVDGSWLETIELLPGTRLITATGADAEIVSVIATERREATYNFQVGDHFTYFIGESRVWVHNVCPIVFKTEHYARRLVRAGVDVRAAETAVQRAIEVGGSFRAEVSVHGTRLLYRAYQLKDRIDVGTIHLPW